MTTCLVTGGAGFVGSHIAAGLAREHAVRIFDDFSTGRAVNVEKVRAELDAQGLGDRLQVIRGSILDEGALADAMRDVDCVFHEAALPSVAFSVDHPLRSNQANAEGTLRVLMAAVEAGVRRVVYAGSSSAYGANPTLPKQEDLPTLPMSPYATAKLTGEHYCRAFQNVHGIETVVLRYFNIFGPRQNPQSQYSAVIPLFINAIRRRLPLRIHGTGEQSRDFTYIENVVRANLLAMTAPEAPGHVINVAMGGRTSLLDLISLLEGIMGREAKLEHVDPRPGDVPHSQADITRARELLGFEPEISIRAGLERTVEYYESGVED